MDKKYLKKVDNLVWEIPTSYKDTMQVTARIIASETILENMDDGVFEQIINVAALPGIQKQAYCMPDGHWGYGFPIGGVAAFDKETGVISPGGIGFDINCGMRLITTPLKKEEIKLELKRLVDYLFKTVPAGVGNKGFLKLEDEEFEKVMIDGLKWAVDNGYGIKDDLDSAEENGRIKFADPTKVSDRARKRGRIQLGTLGSGNHYLEIQFVSEIFDEEKAKVMGIFKDQVVIMIHCGSRGFGHQIASDYLKVFEEKLDSYGIKVNDRQLAAVPFKSKEGQDYYKAMACAANMAFANRQVITHRVREAFNKIMNVPFEEMKLVYDVAHNIAKLEKHKVNGKIKELIVHRKGATRSFGPGSEDLNPKFKKIGQPVILGGSMETGSYLLTGTKKAMELTFGSTAHGSGRVMSRTQAKKQFTGEELEKQMLKKGIYVKAVSMKGLAEEAGAAYKDIDTVIDAIHKAGISNKVASLKPLGNIKG